MKKRILVAMAASVTGAFAAFPYYGTVTDVDGYPVSEAMVVATATSDTAYTDWD